MAVYYCLSSHSETQQCLLKFRQPFSIFILPEHDQIIRLNYNSCPYCSGPHRTVKYLR